MSHWNVEPKPLLNSVRIHTTHSNSIHNFIRAIIKNALELHSQIILVLFY